MMRSDGNFKLQYSVKRRSGRPRRRWIDETQGLAKVKKGHGKRLQWIKGSGSKE